MKKQGRHSLFQARSKHGEISISPTVTVFTKTVYFRFTPRSGKTDCQAAIPCVVGLSLNLIEQKQRE